MSSWFVHRIVVPALTSRWPGRNWNVRISTGDSAAAVVENAARISTIARRILIPPLALYYGREADSDGSGREPVKPLRVQPEDFPTRLVRQRREALLQLAYDTERGV